MYKYKMWTSPIVQLALLAETVEKYCNEVIPGVVIVGFQVVTTNSLAGNMLYQAVILYKVEDVDE